MRLKLEEQTRMIVARLAAREIDVSEARRQLAQLRRSQLAGAPSDSSRTRELMRAIVTEELGDAGALDPDRGFPELGLSSGAVLRVVRRLCEVLGADLPATLLFEYPTLRSLEEHLVERFGELSGAPSASSQRAAAPSSTALSEGQQGLWMLQSEQPLASAYNLPLALRVTGELDLTKLRGALHTVVARHAILRVTFHEQDGELRQTPAAAERFVPQREDASALDDAALEERLDALARSPFSLDEPLLRLHVMRRTRGEHLLLLVVHHIVFDGRSLRTFLGELFAAYGSQADRPLPEPSEQQLSYFDYVREEQAALQGPAHHARLAYWRAAAERPWPVSSVPADCSPERSQEGAQHGACSLRLTGSERERVAGLLRAQGLYGSSFYLSVLQRALAQVSGSEETVVGVALDQRPDARFANTIGFFVTMVPVRSRATATQSCIEALRAEQSAMMEDLAHALPLSVFRRALGADARSRVPEPFRCAYVHQDALARIDLAALGDRSGLSVEALPAPHQQGEYELVCEVSEHEQETKLLVRFDAQRFDRLSIELLLERMRGLIAHIVEHPSAKLFDAPMLASSERTLILQSWGAQPRPYALPRSLHGAFFERARREPGALALVHGAGRLSFGELEQRVRVLARALRSRGVGTDSLVGIGLERSPEMVVGVLGILAAGAAYVPLASEYPDQRLGAMLADSAVPIVLSAGAMTTRLRTVAAAQVTVLDLRADWSALEADAGAELDDADDRADRLAYVIYTSGSTGAPKGVAVEHRQVLNTLAFMQDEYPVERGDSYLLKTNFAFDVSITELFGWFIGRGHLVVLEPGHDKEPRALLRTLRREAVTHVNFVPSLLGVFVEEVRREQAEASALALKFVMVAGEAFPKTLVREAVRSFPRARVENLYGPTEASIYAAYFSPSSCEIRSAHTPIGRPVANTQLYVLDEALRALPVGRAGELYIAGAGLARGYLNRPALSAERFVACPFPEHARMYKTGDLVRWLPSGQLEYLGRIDQQVKVRGYRVELGEIESLLEQAPAVAQAVVVDRGEGAHKQLVAFVVARAAQLDVAALRASLATRLPDYMLPTRFVALNQLPLNANGKVDRAALRRQLDAPAAEPVERSLVAELGRFERTVLKVVRDVLKNEAVELDHAFFEAGGNSLLAVRCAQRLRDELQLPVQASTVLLHPTPRDLARALHAQKAPSVQREVGASPARAEVTMGEGAQLPAYYQRSLAVIGVACHVPGARSPEQLWQLLVEGRDALRFSERAELTDLPAELRDDPAFVPLSLSLDDKHAFDPEFFGLSQRDATFMDPQFRQLLMHAWHAIEDAGYAPEQIPDTSVFISASNSMYQAMLPGGSLPMQRALVDPEKYVSWMLGQGGTIPSLISYKLGLHGQSLFVHSNCSSSLSSLTLAFDNIMAGRSRQALVGAATMLPISQQGYLYQSGLNLSRAGRTRAFDADADGMVGGEGVIVMLVKRASDAVRDRDNIYGLIRGVASNNDGADKAGYYAPSLRGQTAVIERALQHAGVAADTIGYVEAHGTGTKLGDPLEFAALSAAFRKQTTERGFCGLGSVKTNLGHLDTAAGLAGLLKALLSLRHQTLPPSLHYRRPNPELELADSPFYIVEARRAWPGGEHPRRAAVSSFGIGGTNTHAVLEEYLIPPAEVALRAQLIPLSARTDADLRARVEQLLAFVRAAQLEPARGLVDLAFTLQRGRRAMASRVAFVADSLPALEQQLASFLSGEHDVEGVFAERGKQPAWVELLRDDRAARALLASWQAQRALSKLAKLWVGGVDVDWSALSEPSGRRISLPTYPFHCRVIDGVEVQPPAQPQPTAPAASEVYFEKTWLPAELASVQPRVLRKVVILAEPSTASLANSVRALLPGSQVRMLSELASDGELVRDAAVDGVVDLSGSAARAVEAQRWVPVLQELVELPRERGLTLLGVTRGLESLMSDSVELAGALSAGLYRALGYEYRELDARHLDLAQHLDDKLAAEQIARELLSEDRATQVCYRQGRRYVAGLKRLALPERARLRFRADHALWITGGTRGLGALCARHFVSKHGVRKLVLSGKTPIPPRASWDGVACDSALGAKLALVRELERAGAEVMIVQVDLTKTSAVQALCEQIARSLGPIGGVIHAAGSTDWQNPAFIKKSLAAMHEVWSPKVQGLAELHRALRSAHLSFFVNFSSVAAALPALAVGQLDYAMANAYLDYFAAAHAAFPMTSVQWPSWKETGMGEAKTQAYQDSGLHPLRDEDGLRLLDTILAHRLTGVVLPALIDPARWRDVPPPPAKRASSNGARAHAPAAPASSDVTATEAWLLELFARELRLPSGAMDKTVTFDQYGLDSILIAQVLAKIEKALGGVRVNPSLILEYPSVAQLAEHMVAEHAQALTALVPSATSAATMASPTTAAVERAPAPAPRASGAAREKIAVVGLACHFPDAPDAMAYWHNLRAGRDSIRLAPSTRWDRDKYYSPRAGELGKTSCQHGGFLDDIESFDPEFFGISEALARQLDPLQRQWLEVSVEALADAGFAPRALAGRSVGVFAGAKSGNFAQKLAGRGKDTAVGTGQNFISAHLSHFCDFHGPNMVVDAACASALTAVHLACQSLALGESELAVAGGVDILLDQDCFVALSAAQVLAPDGRCKTFSEAADGIGIGEGCGVVILMPLERAIAEGRKVYGVIDASVVNNDGNTMGITTPNPELQRALLQRALELADVPVRSVTYCETHGTGTLIGDPIELKALTAVYAGATADEQFCGVGSAKTNIGHLLNASGMAGLIKVLLSLVHKELPPTLHCAVPNPRFEFERSPFYVVRAPEPWRGHEGVRRAGISSFGFGGHNAHLIVSDRGIPDAQLADLRPRSPRPEFKRRRLWPEQPVAPTPERGIVEESWLARADDGLSFLQADRSEGAM